MERRKRRSQAEWGRIVEEQERSGLTAAGFCRREGIGVGSFYQWKRRLSDGSVRSIGMGGESFIDMGRHAAAGMSMAGSGSLVVTIELGDGARLTVQRG